MKPAPADAFAGDCFVPASASSLRAVAVSAGQMDPEGRGTQHVLASAAARALSGHSSGAGELWQPSAGPSLQAAIGMALSRGGFILLNIFL